MRKYDALVGFILLALNLDLVLAIKTKRAVIVAEGRSGSTFLFSALRSHPHVFGIFEPFYHVKNGAVTADNAKPVGQLIDDVYACNFHSNVDSLYWSEACKHFRLTKVQRGRCQRGQHEGVEALLHEAQCRQAPVRLIKTVRFHHHAQRHLLSLEGIFIIHLLRSPLDVADSWIQQGWFGGDPAKVTQLLCEALRDSRSALVQSRRPVLTVKYDSLLNDPVTVIAQLLDFLGLDQAPAVFQAVNQSVARHTQWSHRRGAQTSSITNRTRLRLLLQHHGCSVVD